MVFIVLITIPQPGQKRDENPLMKPKMSNLCSKNRQAFQKTVFAWFDKNGRKHLPWQQQKTPYRVWLSEIMLQQTQVSTVIPYFERFLKRFPNVLALAKASEDEVMHLWTGLGYYTRARNLLKTAKIIAEVYHGQFPDTIEALQTLPGIGRSTAGAIVSIAFEKKAAILDGNVKRVLTRLHAIKTWPGEKKTEETLWELAEFYTPQKRIADYTQAMMDIGATLCVRGAPHCLTCPFHKNCDAHLQGIAKTLPQKKPKTTLPVKKVTLMILQKGDTVLLEKREGKGVWRGLWSLPELAGFAPAQKVREHIRKHFSFPLTRVHVGEAFRHTFSHYHLDILPVHVTCKSTRGKSIAEETQIWYNLQQPENIGLPAPIKTLLTRLTS